MPAGLDKDDWSDSDYDLTEDDDESDSSGKWFIRLKIKIFFQAQAILPILEAFFKSEKTLFKTIKRFKPCRRLSSASGAIGQIR